MATSTSAFALQKPFEDPLAYLPCSTIVSFSKGAVIYTQDQPASSFYLVIAGKVKVTRVSDEGKPMLVDIYKPDDFFGEGAFLNLAQRSEQAHAIEETRVMVWGAVQIEEIMEKRPRLAVAMVQVLGQRALEFMRRVESFSLDDIGQRLSHSLIRFADRMGEPQEDGSVQMLPLTHETLAQYVGTSREIVTHYMNRLRRGGYVRYTRKSIVLYRDALRESMRQAA
ncbi:MAG TPA: Crp/Fnr family transcriptional regulator [Candidatus Sulfopaludibacter sp.]|jgi:CRP/FNR family transcriptional regulator|nr:Crp/Fnr family transcriptional regulator [Candidatus Sulfopaludibacter sp.]